MMSLPRYISLPQSELDAGTKEAVALTHIPPRSRNWKAVATTASLLLSLSLGLNFYFFNRQYISWGLINQLPSKYAHMSRSVPVEIVRHDDFDSPNRTVQDAAWNHPDLEPWTNFVALTPEYVSENSLPEAQRWPWDISKQVYILTAAHELHCVRILRTAINQYHDVEEQTWPYEHTIHCLNVLRESVMCNADDEPLYVGRLHKQAEEPSPRAGIGGVKYCRDWNKLLEWSRERSACYKPVRWFDPDYNEFDRYKYCPDGSKPWESSS